jgi:putative transposase
MERNIAFAPGEFYHVYNRGIDKHKIFFADGDWKYFQRLLFIRNDQAGKIRPARVKDLPLASLPPTQPLVNIQAYALMPNHFHLLLSEVVPGGISTYMSRLLTSYSMYMNKKYDRSGPLMCRPFRAKHVDNDDYLRWLISYIHCNPLELHQADIKEKGIKDLAKAKQFIDGYEYASYRDYFGSERDESLILNKGSLPFFINDLESVSTMYNLQHNYNIQLV